MAVMLDAGGIAAGDFIAKRLPLIPALLLFAAVIGFVALAYYLGGRKICNMNLVEAIKDDTLSLWSHKHQTLDWVISPMQIFEFKRIVAFAIITQKKVPADWSWKLLIRDASTWVMSRYVV